MWSVRTGWKPDACAVLSCGALMLCAVSSASARDAVVTSFDGTSIATHFFPAAGLDAGACAPTVMVGPGWSYRGEIDPGGGSIGVLWSAGYNVLTWDPRGFGASGGQASIDSPDAEGRDVSALIDFVAEQPEAQLDGPADPRVGMSGGSYGGGIQYVAAGLDQRIDAIVPAAGWHSLITSLYKDETFKQGWVNVLYPLGVVNGTTGGMAAPVSPDAQDMLAPVMDPHIKTQSLDPHVTSAFLGGTSTGQLSAEDSRWLESRGPGDALVGQIRAPALIIAGTVDTLFPLSEDIANYRLLRGNGVAVKMLWLCGGHGVCLTADGGGGQRQQDATLAWLARYLKDDQSIDNGPGFEWIADDGILRGADDYPPPAASPLVGEGSGTLALTPGSTSGAAVLAMPATPSIDVDVTAPRDAQLVGPPKLTLTYSGIAPTTDARLFAQLVDTQRDIVVDNQVTPIPIVLDGRVHTVERPLEAIAASAAAGTTYRLQLVAGSNVYGPPRTAGTVTVAKARVELPVIAGTGM